MKKFFLLLLLVVCLLNTPSFTQAQDRLAECDVCGYCQNQAKVPSNWSQCAKCVYEIDETNATTNKTILVSSATNEPPQPIKGKYFTQLGCINTDVTALSGPGAAGKFVNFLITKVIFQVVGGIAFLYLLYGAYIIITSQANPEKLHQGKQTVTGAVIGLVFTLLSIFIVNIIGTYVLKLPGFGQNTTTDPNAEATCESFTVAKQQEYVDITMTVKNSKSNDGVLTLFNSNNPNDIKVAHVQANNGFTDYPDNTKTPPIIYSLAATSGDNKDPNTFTWRVYYDSLFNRPDDLAGGAPLTKVQLNGYAGGMARGDQRCVLSDFTDPRIVSPTPVPVGFIQGIIVDRPAGVPVNIHVSAGVTGLNKDYTINDTIRSYSTGADNTQCGQTFFVSIDPPAGYDASYSICPNCKTHTSFTPGTSTPSVTIPGDSVIVDGTSICYSDVHWKLTKINGPTNTPTPPPAACESLQLVRNGNELYFTMVITNAFDNNGKLAFYNPNNGSQPALLENKFYPFHDSLETDENNNTISRGESADPGPRKTFHWTLSVDQVLTNQRDAHFNNAPYIRAQINGYGTNTHSDTNCVVFVDP